MTTRRQFFALTGAAIIAPALPAVSAQPDFLAVPYRGRDHYAMCCRLYGMHVDRRVARMGDDPEFKRCLHHRAAREIASVRKLWMNGDPVARDAFRQYRANGYTDPPIFP